jgi:hypothetical protein
LTFTLDTTIATPGVTLANDTGSSNSDLITSDGTLSLANLEPGATVEYSVDGGTTWTNSFTAVEGTNTVEVRQTDVAGNVSAVGTLTFTLDTSAPVVTVNMLSTIDSMPALSGTVDSSASVLVTINGNSFVAINNGDGTWNLAGNAIAPALVGGTYDVVVAAVDEAGNTGYDSTSDELTILTPLPSRPTDDPPDDDLPNTDDDSADDEFEEATAAEVQDAQVQETSDDATAAQRQQAGREEQTQGLQPIVRELLVPTILTETEALAALEVEPTVFLPHVATNMEIGLLQAARSTFQGGLVFDTELLWQRLDAVRHEIESEMKWETLIVGTGTTLMTGLSVGYVLWTLRGSYLLASLMSSIPAWSLIDPLPILDSLEKDDGRKRKPGADDDLSFEAMLS